MRRAILLASAWLCLSACNQPRWDTPEAAYSSFSRAIQRGEVKAAYEALSKETRALIEARSKELSQISGGSVRDEPALMVFATGARPEPITDVRLVKSEGGVATVQASSSGKTSEVRLVKEGERWKVDLTEAFKK